MQKAPLFIDARLLPKIRPFYCRLPEAVVSFNQAMASNENIHVLVVDDDKRLSNVIADVLSLHGFQVHAASTSSEALRSADVQKCDLLITDLVMSPLSGNDLAEELLRQNPKLKVIYMSGYSAEFVKQNIDSRVINLLCKPVTEEDLLGKIKEVLAGS